jgi:probable O-glycosylation ligase (exosortase A-associated)
VYQVRGPLNTFIGGNNEIGLALIMTIPLLRYLQLNSNQKWLKLGLVGAMVLSGIAAIGSQSRGALVGALAMGLFLWLKSRNKLSTGFMLATASLMVALVMPQHWYDRMSTIETYEEDASAQGRINAWHFAFHVATDRPLTGGGFETFTPDLFQKYAPDPDDVHDAHSIYFEVLGEHGFIGLGLFLLLAVFAWRSAAWTIRRARRDPGRKWAADLAAMVQVSLVGYAAGGAFLGLAYFDLYYHLVAIIVLTRRILVREVCAAESPFETATRSALAQCVR